jgi:prefoldin subunit 5
MDKSNSIKDYYVRLERMHNNVFNMLNAINKSLLSNSSEITVTVADSDDVETTMRIPSFLYLESKLEELNTNFGALFNMPESGKAWLAKDASDTYRVEMVRTNSALPSPVMVTNSDYKGAASMTDNNVLKDMVCPKTFIRYNISNLPDLVESMMLKKFVIYNYTLFSALSDATDIENYSDFEAKLYGFSKGTDYDVYESDIALPVKKDTFSSHFSIQRVVKDLYEQNGVKKYYQVILDTTNYYDSEDASKVYSLAAGDKLVYSDSAFEYEITDIEEASGVLTIRETIGHSSKIVPTADDASSFFQIVNNTYGKYHYIDIPLEENEYIAVSTAFVYNGIRSCWSRPEVINLNGVNMVDSNGNEMLDQDGNKMTYIDYYNKYCNNIGDLILGISEVAYPQVSNFSNAQLNALTDADRTKAWVTATLSADSIQVVPINKHLTDDAANEELINLHAQKSNLNSKISSVQSNISSINYKIYNYNSSEDNSSVIDDYKVQLTSYQNEKTELQSQLNDVVNQIASKVAALNTTTATVKYRLRGVTNITDLLSSIKGITSERVEVIGLETRYKYKSVNSTTSTVTIIDSNTFSEWNTQSPKMRDRYLKFNSNLTSFVTEYTDYSTIENAPKWNQIDIPIRDGEDVIVKVRYIYNVGQPLINLYSPWSEEQTFTFPDKYKEDITVKTIIDENNDDKVTSAFQSALISGGFQDHINDKIQTADTSFYHDASHVYSGFSDENNNLLSLKTKLDSIVSDLNNYKEALDDDIKSKYKVSLNINDKYYELKNTTTNKINVYNTGNVSSKFIKVTGKIVIKNTSNNNVRLYPIIKGNNSIPLMYGSVDSLADKISNFERVPLQVQGNVQPQVFNQFIYFAQKRHLTNASIYIDDESQNASDLTAVSDNGVTEPKFNLNFSDYMPKDNMQAMLPYRFRLNTGLNSVKNLTAILNAISALKLFVEEFHSE